jgi:hypothetical protein
MGFGGFLVGEGTLWLGQASTKKTSLDRARASHWATYKRSQGRLGWAGGGSFSLWPNFRVKTFYIFQTTFQFANYFEFNSNLNFEQFLVVK